MQRRRLRGCGRRTGAMTRSDIKVTVGIPTFNRAGYLRESIASVLAQSHREFRLLVCDNASDDDTENAVASFDDPRIDYVRSSENIGMIANMNRIIQLTETEHVLLLPDDDLLYPGHLRATIDVLARYPNVGVVHTAFDMIDASSRVSEHARVLVPVKGPVTIESGDEYLERSMQSTWMVHWASALFRTQAITEAGGLRVEDEPLADFPLLMRVACEWDVACLSASLSALRLHAGAASASVGSFNGVGYDLRDEEPRIRLNQRLRFLGEATLAEKRAQRYRALAERTFRRDTIRCISDRAGAGASSWRSTSHSLAMLVRQDPRTLLLPKTWRLCAAQLGGRRLKSSAGRFASL